MMPPTVPMWGKPICRHTMPPMKAPVPMPKLKMPEKMLMATDVPSGGAILIISLCIAMLKAVPTTPHSASNSNVTGMLPDTGNSKAMHAPITMKQHVLKA